MGIPAPAPRPPDPVPPTPTPSPIPLPPDPNPAPIKVAPLRGSRSGREAGDQNGDADEPRRAAAIEQPATADDDRHRFVSLHRRGGNRERGRLRRTSTRTDRRSGRR